MIKHELEGKSLPKSGVGLIVLVVVHNIQQSWAKAPAGKIFVGYPMNSIDQRHAPWNVNMGGRIFGDHDAPPTKVVSGTTLPAAGSTITSSRRSHSSRQCRFSS